MRPLLFSFIIAVLTTFTLSAQEVFSYETGKYAGVSLNYRMSVINPGSQEPELIVLYLHGGSARGNDNESQLQSQAVEDIYNYLNGTGFHARMLAPQAPEGSQWEGEMIPALKALADRYNTGGSSLCYILGGSMGGNGVWNLLSAYPGYFTGAMPVACNTPKVPVENYAATRICSVAGGRDPRRRISVIESFFKQLEAADTKGARFDYEPEWNHRETCEQSFSAERLQWLFE